MRKACGATFPSEIHQWTHTQPRTACGSTFPSDRQVGPTHPSPDRGMAGTTTTCEPHRGTHQPRTMGLLGTTTPLSHTVIPTRPRARGWWDHLLRNIVNFLINSHHNHQQSPSSSCKWPSWIEPHVITAVAGASRGERDRGPGWFSMGSHVT